MGEIGLKTKYFGSVWEVFILCPLTRYKLRLKIFQMKDLIKIHTRGECHRYSIWLWCYKSSTFFIAIQYPWNMKWPPFGFFGALTLPNIVLSCWNFDQRYFPMIQTRFLKSPSEFYTFDQMVRTQSLRFWSILGLNVPQENQKYC